jgi:sugar O-acyltransferase (sialic acid O-acetyltransferase NeuD family)
LESAAVLASGDDAEWIIAVGDLAVRRRLINSLRAIKAGDGPATIIHPTAWVSPSASIGRGVFIGPRAVVHTRAVIGDHAIINTGSIIEHECQIAENVHAAPGSVLGGRTRVGPDTLIGIGARTLPGISIGREAVVGCGAAVVREVPDSATVAGVPARLLKQSPWKHRHL